MKLFTFLFLLFVMPFATSAQTLLDKLTLEDAQAAYANNNNLLCLERIAELEERGNKGLVILHLKIMATSKLQLLLLDYDQVVQFKKDVEYYLINYDNEDFIQQYKEVYEVSKTLTNDRYSEGKMAFNQAENAYRLKEYKDAMKWYLKADAHGYQSTRIGFYMAYMYENGLDTDTSYANAIKWYTKAAEMGSAAAQHNLGILYFYGRGTAKNIDKAIEWYSKAGEQGNTKAINKLIDLNQYGVYSNEETELVKKDIGKAIYWNIKALENPTITGAERGKFIRRIVEIYLVNKDKAALQWFNHEDYFAGVADKDKEWETSYRYYLLGEFHHAWGEYAKAYDFFDKAAFTTNADGSKTPIKNYNFTRWKMGFFHYEGIVQTQSYILAIDNWRQWQEESGYPKINIAVALFTQYNHTPKKNPAQLDEALTLIKEAILSKAEPTKNYLKALQIQQLQKHFPTYAKDEAAFFDYLAKEHQIIFEK